MGVSPKKVFSFSVRGILDVACPGCIPSAPSNQPLIKWREVYWCYFSVLAFLLLPPTIFSPDTLVLANGNEYLLNYAMHLWNRPILYLLKRKCDFICISLLLNV